LKDLDFIYIPEICFDSFASLLA